MLVFLEGLVFPLHLKPASKVTAPLHRYISAKGSSRAAVTMLNLK